MEDELLDLVDANDLVIGTVNRKDYSTLIKNKLGYIRASELFILNTENKLWVPVRTAFKTIAPNGYDYSAAGHVKSGSTYAETVIREAKEEIGLDITEDQLEHIMTMKSDDLKYFRAVFLHRSNTVPQYNTDDFVSAEWLTPRELITSIDNGHAAKSSLRETVVMLLNYLGGK